MTQQEIQQAISNGNASFVDNPAQTVSEGIPSFTPGDHEPIIETLRQPRIILTSIPTFTPKNSVEQIQIVDDGTTKSAYIYISGQWVQLASVGSGWQLVSYTTAVSGANFTISDLDLDTDLQYHIIVDCRNITNSGMLQARVNNDSSGNYHAWANQGNRFTGGAASESNVGSEADTNWDLNHSTGNMSHHVDMLLGHNNGTPLASWKTASIGKAGDATAAPSTANGGGFWNNSDNITSIKFSHNSGVDCEWRVWVFKAPLA